MQDMEGLLACSPIESPHRIPYPVWHRVQLHKEVGSCFHLCPQRKETKRPFLKTHHNIKVIHLHAIHWEVAFYARLGSPSRLAPHSNESASSQRLRLLSD